MQQRYDASADRGQDRAENRLLDALELQASGLIEMGHGAQVERRLRRLLETSRAADADAGARETEAADVVGDEGLDLAVLLATLVACERRAKGYREAQVIARGRKWLADRMRAAATERDSARAREQEKQPA